MPVAGNTPGHDFAGLVNTAHGTSPGFYTWATTRHPGKPLMIAEWGLFDEGLKTNPLGAAQFYATIADELSRFPAIKALDHFTMELSDTPGQGQATAPWLTAAGWLAWKRLMQDPVFAPHALTPVAVGPDGGPTATDERPVDLRPDRAEPRPCLASPPCAPCP